MENERGSKNPMENEKSLEQVSQVVLDEVLRARALWGVEFDLLNTLNDWAAYINIYLGKATAMRASADEVKTNLRKAAGLVLSALYHAENGTVAPRHYDKG
jgi:hypothetical protein